MADHLTYNATAANGLLDAADLTALHAPLLAARKEVFDDIALMSGDVPAAKDPLDAGFIELPKNLLEDYSANGEKSLVGNIQRVAAMLRDQLDRVVCLGIGGSYMGARALFEALLHPCHNQLNREQRNAIPRISFEGNNLDSDALGGLISLLNLQCTDPKSVSDRWGIVVISKSGGTLETASAFRLFLDSLEHYYGADSDESRKYVVPITGETGKLRNLTNAKKYPESFPIPDGVGGRFSVLTAVGLLPAAVMGVDIVQLLQGAADITEQFRTGDFGGNVTLDYTATCRAWEQRGANIRVLSTWGSRLEALGFWYDQLLSESLGKQEQGATPLTAVNTRDLHSRGQQHQEGKRNKLITNVIVQSPSMSPLTLPESKFNQDDLNQLAGKTIPQLLDAAIQGTNQAYADDNRPTADLLVPKLTEYHLGELLQMFMLATVLEGRLLNINPYGQPGVEGYKNNMKAILG